MLGKRKNKYSSGRHRILVVSVLCLFGFCLLAQVRPAKKGEQKPAKSKVYLLHSDVLKKSPLNPDPDAQILIGNVAFRHDSVYMYCDSACFYEKTNSLSSTTVPLESDAVITRAPNSIAFSIAYWATLPEPETETRIPSKPIPWRFSIASVK